MSTRVLNLPALLSDSNQFPPSFCRYSPATPHDSVQTERLGALWQICGRLYSQLSERS